MAQHSRPGQPRQAVRGWRRRAAAAALVTALAAAAALAGAGPAAAKPKPPVLAFTPSAYDYGEVTTGETASQRFTLTNAGGKATGKLKVTLRARPGSPSPATAAAGPSSAPASPVWSRCSSRPPAWAR
jgi:hypothetical protein